MVAKVTAVEMYGMMPRLRAGDGLAPWIRRMVWVTTTEENTVFTNEKAPYLRMTPSVHPGPHVQSNHQPDSPQNVAIQVITSLLDRATKLLA